MIRKILYLELKDVDSFLTPWTLDELTIKGGIGKNETGHWILDCSKRVPDVAVNTFLVANEAKGFGAVFIKKNSPN